MKFNPNKDSLMFALNLGSREEELATIRTWYKGNITELVGCWEGKEERSYQIDRTDQKVRFVKMLKACNQEAFICINKSRKTFIYDVKTLEWEMLGYMTTVPTKQDCCTYCPSTHTYWKAL